MSGLKVLIEDYCNNRIKELKRDDMIHPAQKAFGIREAEKILKLIREQANEDHESAKPALHKHSVMPSLHLFKERRDKLNLTQRLYALLFLRL